MESIEIGGARKRPGALPVAGSATQQSTYRPQQGSFDGAVQARAVPTACAAICPHRALGGCVTCAVAASTLAGEKPPHVH